MPMAGGVGGAGADGVGGALIAGGAGADGVGGALVFGAVGVGGAIPGIGGAPDGIGGAPPTVEVDAFFLCDLFGLLEGMEGALALGGAGADDPGMAGAPIPGIGGADMPGITGAPMPGIGGADIPGMAGAAPAGLPGIDGAEGGGGALLESFLSMWCSLGIPPARISPSCGAPIGIIGAPDGTAGAEGAGPEEDAAPLPPLPTTPPPTFGALLSLVSAFFNLIPFLMSPRRASLPCITEAAGLAAGAPPGGPPAGGGGGGGGGGGIV